MVCLILPSPDLIRQARQILNDLQYLPFRSDKVDLNYGFPNHSYYGNPQQGYAVDSHVYHI